MQQGNRKVKIAIDYASEEGTGSIKLINKATDEVIVTRETEKKEANQRIEI